jgi:hypothetical protein
MIEFIDKPAPRHLRDCPGHAPSGAQREILDACLEAIGALGVLPPGHALNCAFVAGGGTCAEAGAVICWADGTLQPVIDVDLAPHVFAYIVLHELHHYSYMLAHPEVARHQVRDGAEFQRCLDETEAQAHAFAARVVKSVTIQAAILNAQVSRN